MHCILSDLHFIRRLAIHYTALALIKYTNSTSINILLTPVTDEGDDNDADADAEGSNEYTN